MEILGNKYKRNLLIIMFLLFYYHFCFGENNFNTIDDKIEFYKNRYNVNCLNEKITDNFGNGFDALYGTRNMRTILYGIAYRGGANNFYHKVCKRDNHNPLPGDGLINLSNEGFSNAVYLYPTNYDEALHEVINPGNGDTLKYLNLTGSGRKTFRAVMELVRDAIKNKDKGPIYFHCWNGWHQSGLISSVILMQFCGYSPGKAYDYWLENTDGINKGYKKIKNEIISFKPFDDISIDESLKQKICPCEKKDK